MRFRPKLWILTRAWEPVGVGVGVSELMKRDEAGPLPSLMSIAFIVLGTEGAMVGSGRSSGMWEVESVNSSPGTLRK